MTAVTAKTTSRSSAPALAGERYVENKLKHDARVQYDGGARNSPTRSARLSDREGWIR